MDATPDTSNSRNGKHPPGVPCVRVDRDVGGPQAGLPYLGVIRGWRGQTGYAGCHGTLAKRGLAGWAVSQIDVAMGRREQRMVIDFGVSRHHEGQAEIKVTRATWADWTTTLDWAFHPSSYLPTYFSMICRCHVCRALARGTRKSDRGPAPVPRQGLAGGDKPKTPVITAPKNTRRQETPGSSRLIDPSRQFPSPRRSTSRRTKQTGQRKRRARTKHSAMIRPIRRGPCPRALLPAYIQRHSCP